MAPTLLKTAIKGKRNTLPGFSAANENYKSVGTAGVESHSRVKKALQTLPDFGATTEPKLHYDETTTPFHLLDTKTPQILI